MSERYKHLVDLIQKTAQIPTRSRGDKAPAAVAPQNDRPTSPTKPTGSSVPQHGRHRATGPVGHSNVSTEIQKMQIAMQKVAITISSTINYDALIKAINGSTQQVDEKQVEKSIGRDSFSKILINRMRSAKVKGVEYDTDPKKTNIKNKNPSNLNSLFAVLDSLKRIGAGKDEGNPDGVWGPRTNNGLKNIASVAEALNKLGKELDMQSQAFDSSKMEQLNTLIPDEDKEIEQNKKVARAPVIAALLAGVHALVLDFKSKIISNPNYAVFIDEHQPVFDVGADKEKTFQPSEDEELIYKSLRDKKSANQSKYPAVTVATVTLPAAFNSGTELLLHNITGADLVDKVSFEIWANKSPVLINIMNNNPLTWKNVASYILTETKRQIQTKLNGLKTTLLQTTR